MKIKDSFFTIALLLFFIFIAGCQPATVNTEHEPIVSFPTITTSTITPLPTKISAEDFSVVTLNDGFSEDAPITATDDNLGSITNTLRQHSTIFITELDSPLWNVQWAEDGQSLTYAMGGGSLTTHQNWWHYDVVNNKKQAISSPESFVNNDVRELLGICPFPLPEIRPYPCLPILWESSKESRIVFSSGKLEGEANTWLSDSDGSNAIYLDMFPSFPDDVIWSNNNEWLLIGHYAGVDGSNLYYLVKSDGSFVENLEDLTNTRQFRIQGSTPQFSPNGQKIAFVGIEAVCKQMPCEELDQEAGYNLYVLDLETMERQLISPRLGLFQWDNDGSGLYILDGSANTVGNSIQHSLDGIHYADFYHVDLMQETYQEQQLATRIPIYLPYSGAWAYSPEGQAMAGVFDLGGPIFGILQLE